MEWCVNILFESWAQTSECLDDVQIPTILNESTGFPIPGVSEYSSKETISVPLELSGSGEGELTIALSIKDWAGNTFEQTWNVTMDAIQPVVSWALSPSSGGILDDQFQNLSWWSSEDVTMRVTVNGDELYSELARSGAHEIVLANTGIHVFCLHATDRTIEQENSNTFHECREMELQESTYDTDISDLSLDLVSLDSIDVVLDRHESQEIRWSSLTTGESGVIGPGEGSLVLSLELVEGQNDFVIEVDSLDSTDTYSISLERDSKPPVLRFSENSYRESPLTTHRQLTGECEPGLLVSIRSSLQSRDLTCPDSGTFELNISVPDTPGMHTIEGFTIDHAKNTNSSEIMVLKQDWSEWAIQDAKESGPMLWWLSLIALSIVSFVVLLTVKISGHRFRRSDE